MTGDEYWAMAQVAKLGIRSPQSVIRLRQSPKILVAQDAWVILKTRANSHLVIECLAVVVPHLLQPTETKPRLVGEVCRARRGPHLIRKVPYSDKHECDRVSMCFNTL